MYLKTNTEYRKSYSNPCSKIHTTTDKKIIIPCKWVNAFLDLRSQVIILLWDFKQIYFIKQTITVITQKLHTNYMNIWSFTSSSFTSILYTNIIKPSTAGMHAELFSDPHRSYRNDSYVLGGIHYNDETFRLWNWPTPLCHKLWKPQTVRPTM
jgi:hypothetical protein